MLSLYNMKSKLTVLHLLTVAYLIILVTNVVSKILSGPCPHQHMRPGCLHGDCVHFTVMNMQMG